jgi:hypothetical protein
VGGPSQEVRNSANGELGNYLNDSTLMLGNYLNSDTLASSTITYAGRSTPASDLQTGAIYQLSTCRYARE